jgi:hypothetical protein
MKLFTQIDYRLTKSGGLRNVLSQTGAVDDAPSWTGEQVKIFDGPYTSLQDLVAAVKSGELLVHAKKFDAGDFENLRYGLDPIIGETLSGTEAYQTAEEYGHRPVPLVFASDGFKWAGGSRNEIVFLAKDGFQKSLGDGRVMLPDGSVVPYERSPIADYSDPALAGEPAGVETGDWYSTKIAEVVAVARLGITAANRQKAVVAQESPTDPYLKAVESGDLTTAAKMVESAAAAKGYTVKVHHGSTRDDIRIFQSVFGLTGKAIGAHSVMRFFTTSPNYGQGYADMAEAVNKLKGIDSSGTKKIYDLYLDPSNAWTVRMRGELEDYYQYSADKNPEKFLQRLQQNGIKVIKFSENDIDMGMLPTGETHEVYGVIDPSSVKSAAPVTKDGDAVIPLERRFDHSSPDINY